MDGALKAGGAVTRGLKVGLILDGAGGGVPGTISVLLINNASHVIPDFFIGKREEEGFFFKVEDRDFYPAIYLNMLMYIHKSFFIPSIS